jgi:hypothetical protein
MPYVWRIMDGRRVDGCDRRTATNTGRPAFDALVVFSTWYPIGVMLLVFASRPLGRLTGQRAQERLEMSTSTIEALASAWASLAEQAEFPADYEGTATPQAHRASEAIQAADSGRTSPPRHPAVQPSAPAGSGVAAHRPSAVAGGLRADRARLRKPCAATDANARSYHEEVMRDAERIDRGETSHVDWLARLDAGSEPATSCNAKPSSKAGCKGLRGKADGTRADRPGLAKTLEMLRAADTLAVWRCASWAASSARCSSWTGCKAWCPVVDAGLTRANPQRWPGRFFFNRLGDPRPSFERSATVELNLVTAAIVLWKSTWSAPRMLCAATAMVSMKGCCSTCRRWVGSIST